VFQRHNEVVCYCISDVKSRDVPWSRESSFSVLVLFLKVAFLVLVLVSCLLSGVIPRDEAVSRYA